MKDAAKPGPSGAGAGLTRIGARARFVGAPHLRARGTLTIGDDFVLRSRPVRSHILVDPGGKLVIGDRVAFDHGASISCSSEITIGDGARFGPYCTLLDLDFHEIQDHAAGGVARPIRVGKGALLGPRVTVLRGAVIGEGAVIEAGSTVSRAIPPGVRAGGVPARVLGDKALSHVTRTGDLGELVPRVVMQALRLAEPPQITATRRLFPHWDALAAARIAALLQEETGLDLPREAIVRASSVSEILTLVSRAL